MWSSSSIVWLTKLVSCGGRTPSMHDYVNCFSKNLRANVPHGHAWLHLLWPHWTLALKFNKVVMILILSCYVGLSTFDVVLSFCYDCLFARWMSFEQSPLHFLWLPLFFTKGLLNEPLSFFGGYLFFHQRSFERAPLRFLGVASFFIGGLLNEPLCIFRGLPLFSSEVFWTSPFAFFGCCLFFHRRSFEWAPLRFSRVASCDTLNFWNFKTSKLMHFT
jgi:hypothetical protein